MRSCPALSCPIRHPKLIHAGWSQEEIAELKSALDLLNYGNPKYLILITAWNEAWHERRHGRTQCGAPCRA